jgi:uncharacterized protein YndB with AHSA1/START domain
MSSSTHDQFNPQTDLVLERVIDVPRELVWAAWTQPEHLKKWFAPAPWSLLECEVDLRPGADVPHCYVLARGGAISRCGLLSGTGGKRKKLSSPTR